MKTSEWIPGGGRLQRLMILVAVSATAVMTAGAQEPAFAPGAGMIAVPTVPPSTIQGEGDATIEAVAEFVEFSFAKTLDGDTLDACLASAGEFERTLRGEIEKRELPGSTLDVYGPVIPDVNVSSVYVRATLRCGVPRMEAPAEGTSRLAQLYEAIRACASGAECGVTGPVASVRDKRLVEQAAIGKAIENAYPKAEGAARVMNAQIVSVEHVVIEEVAWGVPPEPWVPFPDLKRLACRARVTVTYGFAAP